MNSLELRAILQQQKNKFQNFNTFVLASDQTPGDLKLPVDIIFNLSPEKEHGSHWVSLYIDEESHGRYMDSFGVPIKNESIKKFVKINCKTIECSDLKFQQLKSNVCGKYAALFLFCCYKEMTLDDFKKLFSKNSFLNDLLVNKYLTYLMN
jgi:hypothetical protein